MTRLETHPTWKLWEWQPEKGAADSAIKQFASAEDFRFELVLKIIS